MTFLKEPMLVTQANQMSVILVTIGVFLNKGFNFQPYVCKRCHDLLMMSKYPSDIGILNFKCADYRFIISEIITNLMQSID